MKKIITAAVAAAMLAQLAVVPVFAEQDTSVGANITVGTYEESAAETQKLIDERPDIQRQMENINRGVVAVRTGESNFVSWRWLGTESADTRYNLYRDGVKVNAEPLNTTNYTDIGGSAASKYQVTAVVDDKEEDKSESASVWEKNYWDIKVEKPADGEVNGEAYTYSIGDASIADLDGDGYYEVVLKWDPSNAHDAAQAGYTGNCIIDAYKLDGTKMWRVDMGKNIRSGAHDTQFMVYDFDGDGSAEMVCRTADGTVAGDGTVIGDADADWREESGKNLTGPLYLTAFKGTDGSVIDTVPYDPQTTGKDYDHSDWGDTWGNRSERYLAAIGSPNGKTTSAVFARGYYTGPEGPLGGRTVIASYSLVEGKLVQDWRFDTKEYDNQYIGQGNHSMSMADVDYDGCDEVIYGSLTVDNDGTPMYSTGLGHGDAQHVGDLVPSRPGLEVFSCHEDKNAAYSYEMRDARTGEILWGGEQLGIDNGRACSGDIDPDYPGDESWSAAGVLVAADGTVISNKYTMAANFLNWWDGDLGRETQDNIYIGKWNSAENKTDTIFTASGCNSINGTKATPCLTADMFGDWREEMIYPTKDQSAVRIFTTTVPTGYKIPTLMSDPQYRNHVALQNTCYNQPTHLSYYLGYDTTTVPVPQMYVVKDGKEVRNPDLAKKSWDIADLYTGKKVELVIGIPTATVNGAPVRIDNDDINVVPYLSDTDNTLVPLRFIAEAFGSEVNWEDATKTITITSADKDRVVMAIGSTDYAVDTYTGSDAKHDAMYTRAEKTMETAPVITNDRTMVPLRVIAEALGMNVYWNDGIITITDVEIEMRIETAEARKAEITAAPVPAKIERVAINGVGEKYYENQLDVYGVEASGNDGNLEAGAVDLDINTRWSAYGANTLTLDLGSVKTVEGVAIAMWKGNERIYPFLIEYSTDGVEWKTALEKTQNTGESAEFEKYMFTAPVEAQYIRYNGDGATDPSKNYCHISEIAVLGK